MQRKALGSSLGMVLAIFSLVFLGVGCQSTQALVPDSDALYQVSLLNALMLGEYDGVVSVAKLKEQGDVGIGTFDALDGEMIMLDGVVYKAHSTGEVVVQEDTETVPFGAVTWFDADFPALPVQSVPDIAGIKTLLDGSLEDFNAFYVAVLEGKFSMVHVRSVPEQTKPYPRLSAIAAKQPEFIYEDLEGTIVAFRCPDYVEGINLPGWHLHFLSDDKKKGGHLLDARIDIGEVQMDVIREFALVLPQSASFASMDVTHDLRNETIQVEGKEK